MNLCTLSYYSSNMPACLPATTIFTMLIMDSPSKINQAQQGQDKGVGKHGLKNMEDEWEDELPG